MGTRGAIVLVAEGNTKILYNHYDSYPEGLGEELLTWLTAVITPIPGPHPITREQLVLKAAANLTAVDEGDSPTEEQKAGLEIYHQQVSTGDDWYAWLRGTQGDLDATLQAGYYIDAGSEWLADSLMCEWAYVLDFDERIFEVYKGFQTAKRDLRGRFRRLAPREGQTGRLTYHPVSLVLAVPFETIIEGLSTQRFLRSIEVKALVPADDPGILALENTADDGLKAALAIDDEHTP